MQREAWCGECGGNPAPVGNPTGGYDRHTDSISDLRHQRQCTGLRDNGTGEFCSEEHSPMPAGFIALRDDGVDATSFQP